jgi:hypothetical protein
LLTEVALPAGAALVDEQLTNADESVCVLEYATRGRRPLLAVGAPLAVFCEFVAYSRGIESVDAIEALVLNTSVPLDSEARKRLAKAWNEQRLLIGREARPGLLSKPGETAEARLARELESYARSQIRIYADRAALRTAREYMRANGAPPAPAPPARALATDDTAAEAHVRALLDWFAASFSYFHLGCLHEGCATPSRGPTKPAHVRVLGSVAPRRLERWRGRASRTELHLCAHDGAADEQEGARSDASDGSAATAGCGRVSRFVRMNRLGPILSARRGRCGEYSHAWLCMLRAAGYSARWVCDFRDHLWCEVQLPVSRAWVHTDPCERAYDQPRLYADVWGKRHGCVVAFGGDGGCVDVTAVYAKDEATWQAEREVSAQGFADALALVNTGLSAEVGARRRIRWGLRLPSARRRAA